MVDTSYTSPSSSGPSPSANQTHSQRRRKSYMQGLLLLLIVVILWTASNFLTNALLTTGGYDKPFFVTYANTSSFALYLIPYLASSRLRKRWKKASDSAKYSRLEQGNIEGATDEQGIEDDKEELPKWLKTLGFDVPTVEAEAEQEIVAQARVIDQPAIKPFVVLAEEQPRGRVSKKHSRSNLSQKPILLTRAGSHSQHQEDSSTASTPLLAPTPPISRPSSPVRPFLVSTSVPRPSSIDGRRPRTSISIVRPPADPSASTSSNVPIIPLALPPLTLRETAILASQFTCVWFGANWAINAGLGLTSVASGTTIGSASGFFTLALGAILGVDRFTLPRLGAVCISALGVAAVTFADRDTATSTITPPQAFGLDGLWKRSVSSSSSSFSSSSSSGIFASKPPNAPLGDMLALLSAFLYSLYVMLLKTRIGSEDRISMPLMFGIVGAINICCLWPFLPILHYTGIESFSLPTSPQIWAGVVVNMCITFVSDFIYLLAMLKSSPLITTLGLSLTIPLAVVIDGLKGSHTGGMVAVIGSTAVLSSFAFIGWDDHKSFKEEKRKAQALAQAFEATRAEAMRSSGANYVDDGDDDGAEEHDQVTAGRGERAIRKRQHSGLGANTDSSALSIRSTASFTSSSSR
ncbi:uncharacterized protein MEPE_05422 [Melanopsichium pennsylvanicum]|uniref:DUF3955 domain-containing protein n=2 Tax=Melanopsichium pennsylvanicum TaxID=63383 RepID=A0AAJ5C7M0_9BASI|nr:conserved hypothetical protein [Melanopsichium pennsylvanicum 4]SNX86713.1 uncharacterized protein MEPE_05422 [Melanopsichium pennsylvanicum]